MAAWKFVLGLAATWVAAPALASQLGGGSAPAIPWLRIALAFLFCIALAGAAITAMRKGRECGGLKFPLRKPVGRAIEILETRRVSQHGDVCLMRCQGQDYLFVVTPHQATLLNKSTEHAE